MTDTLMRLTDCQHCELRSVVCWLVRSSVWACIACRNLSAQERRANQRMGNVA